MGGGKKSMPSDSVHTHAPDPILIGIRRLAMRENIVHVIVAASVT